MSATRRQSLSWPVRTLHGLVWWWWAGAAWAVWALVAAQVVAEQHRDLAAQQDQALRTQLAQLPATVSLQGLELAQAAPGSMLQHISQPGGEVVAGSPALEPYGRGLAALQTQGEVFFLTHAQGVLMQAAAQARQARDGEGAMRTVVWTAAAPWSQRWPSAAQWAAHPWVRAAAVTAVGLTLWAWLCQWVLRRWLERAQQSLLHPQAQARPTAPPLELQDTWERVHALQSQQDQWVDRQRRFLADASHELRTPMAVLRTQLQSAMAGDVPVQELLPQMLHTVDRAAGLANRLLSLSRLEQLQQSGGLSPVDLRQCAHDAVVELAPLIAAKELDFSLEGPALGVPGDAAMLGELVRNLLANAIHHAPHGGQLGILLRQGVGGTELLVWDYGPGLDDGLRPRLFQPYNASAGGVGLGLSICQQIAQAMGADVQLFNRMDQGRVVGVDSLVRWPHAQAPQSRSSTTS